MMNNKEKKVLKDVLLSIRNLRIELTMVESLLMGGFKGKIK